MSFEVGLKLRVSRVWPTEEQNKKVKTRWSTKIGSP